MRRWTFKNVATIVATLIILYAIFFSGYHKYEMDGIIKNTRPESVWNYMADFNKMLLLNPTILDFKILSESGNRHDWRYTVQYSERLSRWPYLYNDGIGHYIVKKSMPNVRPQKYSIESTHRTCFFKGLYCLKTKSEFYFLAEANDTHLHEHIVYECPSFLSGICKREVIHQHKAIMHNLRKIFDANVSKE